jgi:hypothetical protein
MFFYVEHQIEVGVVGAAFYGSGYGSTKMRWLRLRNFKNKSSELIIYNAKAEFGIRIRTFLSGLVIVFGSILYYYAVPAWYRYM